MYPAPPVTSILSAMRLQASFSGHHVLLLAMTDERIGSPRLSL